VLRRRFSACPSGMSTGGAFSASKPAAISGLSGPWCITYEAGLPQFVETGHAVYSIAPRISCGVLTRSHTQGGQELNYRERPIGMSPFLVISSSWKTVNRCEVYWKQKQNHLILKSLDPKRSLVPTQFSASLRIGQNVMNQATTHREQHLRDEPSPSAEK
jgi:hypothetical protein